MRRAKAIYLQLALARSAIVTSMGRNSKAGWGMGRHYCRTKGRLQVCSDWRLRAWEAVGGLTTVGHTV